MLAAAPAPAAAPIACVLQPLDQIAAPAERDGVVEVVTCRVGSLLDEGELVATLKRRKPELERDKLVAEVEALRIASENHDKVAHHEAIMEEKRLELSKLDEFGRRFDLPALERARVDSALKQATADARSSQSELDQAAAEREGKSAELSLAELTLEVSRIEAPFDCAINRIYKRTGEWVNEGEPIAELVKMDELEVVFKLPYDAMPPSKALGATLALRVIGPAGELIHKTTTRVTRLQPQTDISGLYLGFGSVANKRVRTASGESYWLLMPGLEAIASPLGQEPDADKPDNSVVLR